ncbi:MAG: hypothetical protein U5L96_19455 [Owenweeksia sp.]|nr:hypothetical protein [Owenweeksia sp.]
MTAKLAALLGLIACQGPPPEKRPVHVIPADSMALILTDIHLVEGAKVGQRIMGDSLTVAG